MKQTSLLLTILRVVSSIRTHGYNASDLGKQERIPHDRRRYDHIRRCLLSLLLALALLTPLLPTAAYPSMRSSSVAHAQEPCGGKIAFVRDGNLWIMNSDGSEQRELTHGVQHRPSWSPDGKEIAFSAYPQWRIHVINVQTRQLRELAGRPGCLATDPSWSPDGLSIAYYFQCGNTSNDPSGVAIMDTTDGSNSSDLFMNASFPIWSPDGSKIAARRGPPVPGGEPAPGLYVCDRDGSPCERLTDRIGSAPSWSPDGQFITQDDLDGIWLFPVDGDPPRKLVKGFYPSWAPDSTRIVFVDVTDGGKIALINVNGTGYQQLTEGNFPAWQPCSPFSIAETLEEKRDDIAFLSHPTIDFLGVPVPASGYDESAATELVRRVAGRNQAGSLTAQEASAFIRLQLTERALRGIYPHYAQITDDAVDGTLTVILVGLGMLKAINKAAENIESQLGEGPFSEAVRRLKLRINEKILDLLNGAFIQVENSLTDETKRETFRMLRESIWRIAKMRIMEEERAFLDRGQIFLDIFADVTVKPAGMEIVLARYVNQTQRVIDSAVRSADYEYSGVDKLEVRSTDERAKIQVKGVLDNVAIWTEHHHGKYGDFKEAANIPRMASDLADLASLTGIAAPIGQAVARLSDLMEILMMGYVSLESWQYMSELVDKCFEAEAGAFDPTTPLGMIAPESKAASTSASLGLNGGRARAIAYGRSTSLQNPLQVGTGEYQATLQKVLEAVQKGDREELAELIPELMSQDRELAAQMKVSQGLLLSAAKPTGESGQSQVPQQIFGSQSALDLAGITFYAYLIDNLVRPGDAELIAETLGKGRLVQQSLGAYQETLEEALPVVKESAPATVVLIASYSVPGEIVSGQPFELTAKVVNAGAESVSDISIRVVGGKIVPAEQTVALGKIVGTEEKVLTFQLQAVGSGTEILTLDVLKGDDVLSTQLVCASVAGEPVGGVLAPKESEPPKLPIPCCGLGITSVMMFLLVWLQLVRPTISS